MPLHADLRQKGLGWLITYRDDEGSEVVRFDCGRMEVSPYGPSCTITVGSRLETARTLSGTDVLFTERLLLFGSRSRDEFAKALDRGMPPPPGGAATDWGLITNEVVNLLLTEDRRPLQAVNLRTVERLPEAAHLVPGFLLDGKATILYGAGGTGKSMFAAGVASAVATGASFAGWDHVRTGNVLYLDWETDEQDLAMRVYRASRGLGLREPAPVHYLHCGKPLETMHAEVARIVKEKDVSLVIVDSVGMASVGSRDGDIADSAIRFFMSLRMLGCAVLAIDHIASEDVKSKGGTVKPYGSVFKVNAARLSYELAAIENKAGEHQLVLRHRKSNVGPRLPDKELLVHWQPDSVFFENTSFIVTPTVSVEQRIHDALLLEPLAVMRLVEVVNDDGHGPVTENEVRDGLRHLLHGRTISIDGGTVSLSTD